MWGVRAININESCCHIVIIKLGGAVLKQISALQAPGDSARVPAHHQSQYFIIAVITGARSGNIYTDTGTMTSDSREPADKREGGDKYGNN